MWWLPDREANHVYLYKLHGCISEPGIQNLVVTEEDYINFLANATGSKPDKRLLNYVAPDRVHVLAGGKIIKSGDGALAHEVEDQGYGPMMSEIAAA